MKNEKGFARGLRDGIPIALGYLSVSFAFGIFAVGNGLTVFEALMISMTNVTSAGQLSAVPIITGGGTLAELALTQLIINLRYSLMSVTLSQKLDGSVRLFDRFALAFVNTDEVFAVATARPTQVNRRYMYGLIVMPYLGWSAGTLVGALAGDIFPAMLTSALGVAIYGMFIAIVIPPVKRDRSVAECCLIAIVLSCIFRFSPTLQAVPTGFTVIVCAVIAGLVMAVIAPVGKTPQEVSR